MARGGSSLSLTLLSCVGVLKFYSLLVSYADLLEGMHRADDICSLGRRLGPPDRVANMLFT